ncbi:MAG: hypothetical protein HY739_14890 [Desulfobacterales bacterium]|nr:hypothetical protein [Desulfobacterales bacterium]
MKLTSVFTAFFYYGDFFFGQSIQLIHHPVNSRFEARDSGAVGVREDDAGAFSMMGLSK